MAPIVPISNRLHLQATAVSTDLRAMMPPEPSITGVTLLCVAPTTSVIRSTDSISDMHPSVITVSNTVSTSPFISYSWNSTPTSFVSSASWPQQWNNPTRTDTQGTLGTGSPSPVADTHFGASSARARAIGGGVTGGVIGLIVVLLALHIFYRRYRSRQGSQSKEEQTGPMNESDPDGEPHSAQAEDHHRSMATSTTPSRPEGGTNIMNSSQSDVIRLQVELEQRRIRLVELERNEERYDEMMREVVSLRHLVNMLVSQREAQLPSGDHTGPPSYCSGRSSE